MCSIKFTRTLTFLVASEIVTETGTTDFTNSTSNRNSLIRNYSIHKNLNEIIQRAVKGFSRKTDEKNNLTPKILQYPFAFWSLQVNSYVCLLFCEKRAENLLADFSFEEDQGFTTKYE